MSSSVGCFFCAGCPISSRMAISGASSIHRIHGLVGGASCFRHLTVRSLERPNVKSRMPSLKIPGSRPTGAILETHLRDQVRRAVQRGRWLMQGGYLDLVK
jgi:hypothetical protein